MRLLPMMLPLLICLLAPAAGQAASQTSLPGLYRVVGVEPGDRLNVRAAPDAQSDIVASIAPGTTGVEVVGLDPSGRWGQVNTREGSGFVAMRFLAAEPLELGPEGLPRRLSCYGTEPFWSLAWGGDRLTFATPEDEAPRPVELDRVLSSMTLPRPHFILLGTLEGHRMTAIAQPAACSDGMSDRRYGLGITLVREGEVAQAYSGCCSLEPFVAR